MNLQQIPNVDYPCGAHVDISGNGLKPKISLGIGIVQYLAEIPVVGIILRDVPWKNRHKKQWLMEDLLNLELVKKIGLGSGIYMRTEAADKALYDVKPDNIDF